MFKCTKQEKNLALLFVVFFKEIILSIASSSSQEKLRWIQAERKQLCFLFKFKWKTRWKIGQTHTKETNKFFLLLEEKLRAYSWWFWIFFVCFSFGVFINESDNMNIKFQRKTIKLFVLRIANRNTYLLCLLFSLILTIWTPENITSTSLWLCKWSVLKIEIYIKIKWKLIREQNVSFSKHCSDKENITTSH